MILLHKYDFEPQNYNVYEIKPTIFPDNTSQVWQLPEGALYKMFSTIVWKFENESELIHVLQLGTLLKSLDIPTTLSIPYLPYARQDKDVANDKTFALKVFLDVLEKSNLFLHITTEDAHNPFKIGSIDNKIPNDVIQAVISKVNPDIICFPDKGASQRGYITNNLPTINLDKVRNQLTGNIEGLTYLGNLDLTGKSLLLLDDLCDGGRTFIEATKMLDKLGVSEVNLYVSHGIFSKGTNVLFESGIHRIFTREGEILNEVKR